MNSLLELVIEQLGVLMRGLLLLLVFVSMCSTSSFGFDVLPDTPPIPSNNPQTKEKVQLGKRLYFDARLSKNNKVSCNSCHNAQTSGTDNMATSKGIDGQLGGRNAPTVLNAAYLSVQFWDGRANTLEDQAKGPIINPIEMGMPSHDAVVEKLKQIPGYVSEFKKVFGGEINIDRIAQAIAAYERTLVTPNAPFDRYMKGNKKALSPKAIRGMKLVEKIGCNSCHMGPNFAGPALPTGNGFYQKFPTFPDAAYEKKYEFSKDLGRYEVTKKEEDKNMWRVPTWRNVAITGPYFHNGKVKTLDEAVRIMAKMQLNRILKDNEVKEVVAFLGSLTGKQPRQSKPSLPN
ncbi:MAG: cytochrome-c peroxidase [Bacteriovoracia bacterium]